MKSVKIKPLQLFIILFLPLLQIYAQIYVATDGSDSNPGSFSQPFASIPKAISVAIPGDTIYVRGGTYEISSTIYINSSQSGTDSSRYYLVNYPGERPLLDFSSQSFGNKGFSLRADYWIIKGLDITGAGDNGLQIYGGSYNIVENCSFFENRDSGVQLSSGASYNRIINCDSYYNADPTDYGDADGFAPKLDVGSDNYFYGCRAWGNCDDGWDGYMRGADDVTTILENCWTWGNGYLKDGSDPGSQANGNGFKMGGGDDGNADQLMHHHILKNCLAFHNKNKGFDQNNNVGSMTLINCTGFGNQTANYRIKRELNAGQTLTVTNSISYQGGVELGAFAIQESNSWLGGFSVTEEDFITLNPEMASAPRQADGSLPEIDFMHLARGSDLIDAGVETGLPFYGEAPDLGAFESNYDEVSVFVERLPENVRLLQNYPNPFNASTTIRYSVPKTEMVTIEIYDIHGRWVTRMVHELHQPGTYMTTWDTGNYSSGAYLYRIYAGEFVQTRKMILVK